MKSEIVNETDREKEIREEAEKLLVDQIYIWNGQEGVFVDEDDYKVWCEDHPCHEHTENGMRLAAPKEYVENPDWKAILAEREKGNDSQRMYFQQIVHLKKAEDNMFRSILYVHWEKGRFVDEVSKDCRKWGQKTIHNIAKHLGVSVTQAYVWHQMYKRTPQKILDAQVKAKLTWSDSTQLMKIKDEADYKRLEKARREKKLSYKELVKEVKKVTRAYRDKAKASGKKVDGRGSGKRKVNLDRLFKSVETMAVKFDERLADFSEGYKAFSKLSREEQDGTMKPFKSAVDALVKVKGKLDGLISNNPSKK